MKELKKGLISVIVPCYNVEKFLPDCFASLEAQTYKNFEVIFVNDGSTDASKDLLENFCADKPNFCVITKPNGGLSSARNEGLAHANGEFVFFADSDDYFDARLLEIAHDAITNADADVCIFKNKWVRDGRRAHFSLKRCVSPRRAKHLCTKVIEGSDTLMSLHFSRHFNLAVWTKLYSHAILEQFSNYPKVFDETTFYSEDVEFAFEFFKRAKKATRFNLRLYSYRMRQGSIIRSPYSQKKFHILEVFERFEGLDEKEFPTAPTYIRSLKATSAIEALIHSTKNCAISVEQIEEAYKIFKTGLRDIRKGRLNFWYIKLFPFALPYAWLCKKKAIKQAKKKSAKVGL